MIEEHGFLDESKVGFQNYLKVEIMMLHFDRDTTNVLLQPILDEALTNGQITPLKYAMILDRHLENSDEVQKFWTWFFIDSDPQFSKEEKKEIIKLRESIGLYGTELVVNEYKGTYTINNLSHSQY